jgi:hypothetical protein
LIILKIDGKYDEYRELGGAGAAAEYRGAPLVAGVCGAEGIDGGLWDLGGAGDVGLAEVF